MDPDCRFVRTAFAEDGTPDVTSYPKDYFVSTLKKTPKGMLVENITKPFVQTRDNLAHVWCRCDGGPLRTPTLKPLPRGMLTFLMRPQVFAGRAGRDKVLGGQVDPAEKDRAGVEGCECR